MAKRLPAIMFYTGDWLKDPNLRRCTAASRGVWMDMLCFMFDCEERGVLATAGQAWSDEDVARAVGGDLRETLSCVDELVCKGVVSRNSSGALYCRRMVRDENKRHLCTEAGKRGGNPTLKGHPKGRLTVVDKGPPETESETEDPSSKKKKVYPADFLEFWEAYPKKAAKGHALKAWQSAVSRDSKEEILEAARRFAESPKGKGDYCPHPATWLNGSCYEDDQKVWERDGRPSGKNSGEAAAARRAGSHPDDEGEF